MAESIKHRCGDRTQNADHRHHDSISISPVALGNVKITIILFRFSFCSAIKPTDDATPAYYTTTPSLYYYIIISTVVGILLHFFNYFFGQLSI